MGGGRQRLLTAGACPAAARPHQPRYRSPAVHHPGRRPDPGAGRRPPGGAGHPRRAAGTGRPLRPPLRDAVRPEAGTGPISQYLVRKDYTPCARGVSKVPWGASHGAVWIQLAPADMPFQQKAAAAVGHRCRDVFWPLRIVCDLPQTSEVSKTSEVSRRPPLPHALIRAGGRHPC